MMMQVINILSPFLAFASVYKPRLITCWPSCLTPTSRTWMLYEILWAMHMQFKLWQIMTLILCALFYYKCFFHFNLGRVTTYQLMVVEDDDLFLGRLYHLWWCNHVHIEEWVAIVSVIGSMTSKYWKPFNLVGKTCYATFACFFPCSLSPWYYGITYRNKPKIMPTF